MKYTISSVIAFAAAALAKPILTNTEYPVEEGQPFTITWANAEGPVTLTLKNGPSKNLQDVTVIASDLTGTEFTWTPEDLPSDTYAIEIRDSTDEPNYSIPFVYEGTGTAPSVTSSAEASSTAESSTITSVASSTEESSSTITSAASSAESSSLSKILSATSTTSTSTTRTAPVTTPTNQNEGQRFSSPLALLMVTVAAVFFFN
ncbi:Ser-Thr-rich glycosyl-phosphatidyl-inositol-anchored membrane family domain containing protein [Naviculisporaceae sp. PSN 640]